MAALGNSWGLEEILAIRRRLCCLRKAGALTAEAAVLPAKLRMAGLAYSAPEFRRRRLPMGHVSGFDLQPFNEHAPLWRAHNIKRSSMMGWSPSWLSSKSVTEIDWFANAECGIM